MTSSNCLVDRAHIFGIHHAVVGEGLSCGRNQGIIKFAHSYASLIRNDDFQAASRF
jgi:hypothetical protein